LTADGSIALSVKTGPAAAGAAPRALMFVVDASSAESSTDLSQERAAVTAMAAGLPADVSLGLVAVTTQPILAQAPTTDRGAFAASLAGILTGGRRALYDAVGLARSTLDGSATGGERRIILVGTGADTVSTVDANALGGQLSADGIVTDGVFSVNAPQETVALIQASGGQVRSASSLTAAAGLETGVFQPAIGVTATVPAALAGQAGQLNVSVTGTALTTSVKLTFGGTALAPNAPTSTPTHLGIPSWLGMGFAALLFLAVLIAVLGIVWPRSVRQERIRQISNFGPGARAAAHAAKSGDNAPVSSVIARTALAATAQVVRTGRMEERISRRLERAGMRMRAHEWVLLRTCAIVACAALLFAVTNWFGAIIGAAIGYASTLLFQTVRIDRRSNQFTEQLPDALQLVIGSLRSGFSLPQAFDSLAREAQEPVASEFGRALSEHRLGADISDALERLAQRVESEDLGWTVMAVRIQREVGGNLAEVLQTTVDTMRERGRLRRHVRSLSAEGRMSAYVLIGLPLILGTFMFVYRRAYMTPLLTDPLGITMLSLGGLLFVLGIFWMTRVVRVEA
jgi:tight adherence protein B